MPFRSLGLPEPVARGVQAAGYDTPTPIQEQAIPIIIDGHDLVAAAQTGSGKTAAFLLPMLARLSEGASHGRVRALILVPTRELAAQVEANAKRYARFTGLRVGAVYGGVHIGPHERMLMHEGVDLLVATPGRLLDLQGRQAVSLDEVEILVLDEADRMVDMGFAPDLKRILHLLPRDRQTLMFSATMPPELNSVAKEALYEPRRLALAPPTRPADRIEQMFYPVPQHLKLALLDEILRDEEDPRTIVFARTKRGADRLARRLAQLGHRAAPLHGDRSQSQRERALRDFKRGRVDVLVATDIASRGIDVDDVTHVINFDVPRSAEDYVHRIGRTGRMDASGDALTLVSPGEEGDASVIERSIGRRIERRTVEGFDYRQRAEKRSDSVRHERSGSRRGGNRDRGEASRGGARPAGEKTGRSTVLVGEVLQRAASEPEAVHGRRRRLNATDRRNRKRM